MKFSLVLQSKRREIDNNLNADTYYLQRLTERVLREILLLNGGGIEAALPGPLPGSIAIARPYVYLLCADDRPNFLPALFSLTFFYLFSLLHRCTFCILHENNKNTATALR